MPRNRLSARCCWPWTLCGVLPSAARATSAGQDSWHAARAGAFQDRANGVTKDVRGHRAGVSGTLSPFAGFAGLPGGVSPPAQQRRTIRNAFRASPAALRLRRAGAAHRRRRRCSSITTSIIAAYVNNLNAATRWHASFSNMSIDELVAQPEPGAGRQAHGGPQQRRRPLQPLDVLGDHAAGRRRRAAGATSPRRSTTPSAASTRSRRPSTRRASAASAPAGPGSSSAPTASWPSPPRRTRTTR